MSATALTLLVIDAFAAAMFGRLRSVPRTFVGALVLGLAGSYVIGYFPSDDWTWTGNFRVSLPMIVLFVVLLFLPQDRLRGTTVLRSRERFRMPTCRTALVAGGGRWWSCMFLLRGHPGAHGDQQPGVRHDDWRSSPCRWCCSPATRARSTWRCCRSARSGRSSSTTSA